MKYSTKELLGIAYQHYPRGILGSDPRRETTQEYLNLKDACQRALQMEAPFRSLVARASKHFSPHLVKDESLRFGSGEVDASYAGVLHLPLAHDEHFHALIFLVSILAPYYIILSVRIVDDPVQKAAPQVLQPRSIFQGDTCYIVPSEIGIEEFEARIGPTESGKLNEETKASIGKASPLPQESMGSAHENEEKNAAPAVQRCDITLEPSPDEKVFADWIGGEIEAIFGYERLASGIAEMIVPELSTSVRALGKATLLDCLFSDRWTFEMSPVEPKDALVGRVAELLSAVMNLQALLSAKDLLDAADPSDLRSALLHVADEIRWLIPIADEGVVHGLSLPADMQTRLDRLCDALLAWPSEKDLGADILDFARDVLDVFSPGSKKP